MPRPREDSSLPRPGYAKAILLAFENHGITLDPENCQAILDCQDA